MESNGELERVKLWFDFYQLALDTPDLSKTISNSGVLRIWQGVSKTTDFAEWWEEHKGDFSARGVEVIDGGEEWGFFRSVLHMVVPLALNESVLIEQIRREIRKAQAERKDRLEHLNDFEDEVPVMGIHVRLDSQLRVKTKRVELELYRKFWHGQEEPIVDDAFVKKAQEYLLSIDCLPLRLKKQKHHTNQSLIKNFENYLKRGRSLVEAAATTTFPGPPEKGSEKPRSL